MEKTAEQRVAEAINEKPVIVKVGERDYTVLPLTFGQIVDFSALVSQMKGIEKDDAGRDLLSATIAHVEDIEKMIEIALVVMFRDPQDREKNRDYIRQNLGENEFAALQELYIQRLNTAFFLQSIISLKNLNQTAPTVETTIVHGQ